MKAIVDGRVGEAEWLRKLLPAYALLYICTHFKDLGHT
jgi:hypothetical protein